ncbi:MAG: hypothetical protein BGO78_03585 [Chloroflexi bacterium 44-23]|nr:MAG: hypothetical protein BGO78_03585 [Chloroflexi bacterium 44-23]
MKKSILVIKQNTDLQETWRYQGRMVNKVGNEVTIEAKFNRKDYLFNGIMLKEGDTFVETYYSDRWYNIFAMYDRDSSTLKGWYCNITYPAEISFNMIKYVDLALDLLVRPDGEQIVLDRKEFEDLELDEETRQKALAALAELQQLFRDKFDDLITKS